jgi:hypothetical protein
VLQGSGKLLHFPAAAHGIDVDSQAEGLACDGTGLADCDRSVLRRKIGLGLRLFGHLCGANRKRKNEKY